MLRKIDCIMIPVEDVAAAAAYYATVFCLHPLWSGDGSIGLVFPETEGLVEGIKHHPFLALVWFGAYQPSTELAAAPAMTIARSYRSTLVGTTSSCMEESHQPTELALRAATSLFF